jgi:hypothetical protein
MLASGEEWVVLCDHLEGNYNPMLDNACPLRLGKEVGLDEPPLSALAIYFFVRRVGEIWLWH